MTAVRTALGALGVLVLGWGLWLVVGLGSAQILGVLRWVVGGIVLHDGALVPVVVLLGVVAAARVPDRVRAPLVGALVVLGPLTLVAVPVLGRYGARPDNPTLLDRPYWSGYLAIVALVVVATVVWTLRRRSGTDPDRRS